MTTAGEKQRDETTLFSKCPCCDSDTVWICPCDSHAGVRVECQDCGVSMKRLLGKDGYYSAASTRLRIAWNRRAPDPRNAALVEALTYIKKIIDDHPVTTRELDAIYEATLTALATAAQT